MDYLFITSDHAAFHQKEMLKRYLSERFEVIDLGADSEQKVPYPKYGKKIAQKVLEAGGRGIALCGSGIGISIQVNRYKGIRGALCHDGEEAALSRQHNNSNILCLAGRKHDDQKLQEIVDAWLVADFEGGRHQERIEMLDE